MMMKVAKRCIWWVSAMVCASVLLSGCSSNTAEKPASGENVTIRLDQFSGNGESEEALKKMIE